jgi:hypothetical protein
MFGNPREAGKKFRDRMFMMNETPDICEPRPSAARKSCPRDFEGGELAGLKSTSLFIEEIHIRAETITPLLREILEFRPKPR